MQLGAVFLGALREAYARAIPASLKGVTDLVVDECPDLFWAQGAAAVALHDIYETPAGNDGRNEREET